MFGHNSFDSPQLLVFGTSPSEPQTFPEREIYGDTPEFYQSCADLKHIGWMMKGGNDKGLHQLPYTHTLGAYWLPKGWSLDLHDENGNFAYTDIAIKEGKVVCEATFTKYTIKRVKSEYVGFCEDSNRKSLREGLVGDVITNGKSHRDMEGVCGECVDGYEENDDGVCVEKQDDEPEEETEESNTNKMLLAGGALLAVVLIGSMVM